MVAEAAIIARGFHLLRRTLGGATVFWSPGKRLSVGSMKKAIGTFDICLSELDIRRRRLTLLSCMPPGGKTHEMRPSFTGTPDFFNPACAEA
jgi:hypothetical protein